MKVKITLEKVRDHIVSGANTVDFVSKENNYETINTLITLVAAVAIVINECSPEEEIEPNLQVSFHLLRKFLEYAQLATKNDQI